MRRNRTFSVRVVDHWNSLLQEEIDSESVNRLQRMFDRDQDPAKFKFQYIWLHQPYCVITGKPAEG